MATLKQIIDRALVKAKITAVGGSPSTEHIQPSIDMFNDMLEQWRDEGLDLGLIGAYTEPEYTANTPQLPVDRGAVRTIIYNLAVELAVDAGVAVSDLAVREAERSRASLASRLVGSNKVQFDPALRFNINTG